MTTQIKGNDTSTFGGAITANNVGAGNVLQVKHSNTQNTISTTATTYTATGHSIAITPSSSSSKFLIMINGGLFWNDTDGKEAFTEIFRDIGGGGYNRISPYSNASPMDISGTYGATLRNSHSICWLDSPNTTSVVTYQPYFRTNSGGTAYYNLSSVLFHIASCYFVHCNLFRGLCKNKAVY